VLADHASSDERKQLMRDKHWPLLAIGIVTGYLGAAPSLLWAVSAATLVLVLPPLIWGWLTYKVMSFDVLADHASLDVRKQLMRDQHWPLLAIGIVTGYLGAAPSLLWAVSAATLVLAPLLVVLSVWLYTLVFAFAALWFAHFALAALQRLRQQATVELPAELVPLPAAPSPPALEDSATAALPPPP